MDPAIEARANESLNRLGYNLGDIPEDYFQRIYNQAEAMIDAGRNLHPGGPAPNDRESRDEMDKNTSLILLPLQIQRRD